MINWHTFFCTIIFEVIIEKSLPYLNFMNLNSQLLVISIKMSLDLIIIKLLRNSNDFIWKMEMPQFYKYRLNSIILRLYNSTIGLLADCFKDSNR